MHIPLQAKLNMSIAFIFLLAIDEATISLKGNMEKNLVAGRAFNQESAQIIKRSGCSSLHHDDRK